MLLTVADLMTHMAVQLDTTLGGTLEAKVRTAVLAGWGRLMTMKQWLYFHRSGSIRVYAGMSTGSISYDTSTRVVTLTGATWPSDVTTKHIRIVNNWYPVFRRLSPTSIELYEGNCPVQAVTGVEYLLQQVLYPLPYEVGDILQIIEGQQNLMMMRLSVLEAHVLQEGPAWTPALPTTYSLVGDSANPRRWCLWLPTQQTVDTNLQYLYCVRKPPEVLVKESRGLCSVSGGVATFTDPVVKDSWANAVLRISTTDTTAPTGDFGNVEVADVEYNPGAEARVVAIISSTQCRISDATVSLNNKAYTASTHVDCADGPMQTLLLRLVESEYGTRPVGGHTEMMVSSKRLADAFHDAAAADGRQVRNKSVVSQWYTLRLSDVGIVRKTL